SEHLGNYWRYYTSDDLDGNGIGDAPYYVGESEKDEYPLLKPWETYFPSELLLSKTAVPNEIESCAQSINLQDIPLQDIPLQDIPLQDIPLQDIGIGGTPLQDIPLQDISIAGIPLQDIPLQDIPIVGTPLQDIPLQDIGDIDWDSILIGTVFEGRPLSEITLGDLSIAGLLDSLTLSEGGELLQHISMGSALIAAIGISEAPLQDIPLQDIPLQDITISGTPLQDIPLQDIPLQDITVEGTPLQDIPLQDIELSPPCTWEELLIDTGIDVSTATFGEAISHEETKPITLSCFAPGTPPLLALTLGDVLLVLIPLEDISWESIPLRNIPFQDFSGDKCTITYTITLDNSTQDVVEKTAITDTLPKGFNYVPGSSFLHTGATPTPIPDPLIEEQKLTWEGWDGPFSIPADSMIGIEFKAKAPTSLGTYYNEAGAISDTHEIPNTGPTAPVTVIDTFEPNNSIDEVYEIDKDILYASYISTDTDVDWYKLEAPERLSLVTIYLSHLPADYDLVLLSQRTPSDIPLQDIPLQDIPLQDIPLQDIPLQDIPLQDIPLQDIPLQDIPLQDISLWNISMERGTKDEIVTHRVSGQTGDYYILVSGYNGAHSNEPYMLRAKATEPPPIAVCPRDNLPIPGSPGELYVPKESDTETLIITNESRLYQYYEKNAVEELRTRLKGFADLDYVNGMILPVESDEAVRGAYDTWDENACDPEAANAVSNEIRKIIHSTIQEYSKIKYVIIVGNDEIVPFYRVPDEVYLSNESTYTNQANIVDSALYASLAHGFILTDDYYVDMAPIPWRGRELYVPDYPIGRLVETPAEMTNVLQQFQENSGILTVNSALISGYDFLSDGAEGITSALAAAGVPIDTLIHDAWTQDDLAELLLKSPSFDVSSTNAHCNHYAVGPPIGEPFYSDQLSASLLEGKLVFSMGCHAGLNIDDSLAKAGTEDRTFDLPQALAQEAAWFVGNTGYGYGDSDVIALSEELMGNFATALTSSEQIPVGQALIQAKQEYFLSMGSYGPFDEKILIESTLYGLPMYQFTLDLNSQEVTSKVSLLSDVESTETTPTELHEGPNGYYYTAHDGTQMTPYRPIQPRIIKDISYTGTDKQTAHGVLLTGANYKKHLNFDPIIARPVDDHSLYEPQFINQGWYPSKMHTILSLYTPSGLEQSLVLTPGQFITTGIENNHVVGTERIYGEMSYQIYYSDSDDYSPPVIEEVRRVAGNPSTEFAIKVIDEVSPVQHVIVMWTHSTKDNEWRSLELSDLDADNVWTGSIEIDPDKGDIDFFVQAVDEAGNVGMSTNKGHYFQGLHNQTTIACNHDVSGQYSDQLNLRATLTSYGIPIEGRTISFTVGDQTTDAVTDEQGIAQTTIAISQKASTYSIESLFQGDAEYRESSEIRTVNILHEETTLEYTGNASGIRGDGTTHSARLAETDNFVGDLAGKTIIFSLGDEIVSTVTDSNGVATIDLDQSFVDPNVKAVFEGDDYYRPCSSLLVESPGGGLNIWYVSPYGNDHLGDGSEFWIDNDSSGNWSTGDSGPWRTIGYAVDQASDNHTIKVMDDDDTNTDDYTENVVVDKSLTIERYDSTGPNPQVKAGDANNDVILVVAPEVTIRGLDIHGAMDDSSWGYAGIHLEGVNDCLIENNRCGWDANHTNYYGIQLTCSDNNIVTGNTADSNSYGIALFSSNDNSIYENVLSNNCHGIHLCESYQNLVDGNVCSENECFGIDLLNSNDNMLARNTIGASYCGISLASSIDNVVADNISSENTHGIELDGSSENIVVSNIFSDNNWHGILLTSSSYNNIYLNSFVDNDCNVGSSDSSNTWNSPTPLCYFYGDSQCGYLGNFYSDYTGEDTNLDGVGDIH
ncbi:MAG: NosD domain-containing protein, partial [Chloroflexota bacterium]|nr:NosD domain-containing protein [Chloroflexota bacterium]